MQEYTNIKQVKSVAKAILFLDFEETKLSPMLVKHPYTDTGFTMLHGENQMINLVDDKEGCKRWREAVKKHIESQQTAFQIYNMLTKSYLLSFVKLIEQHLSKEDLSQIWSDTWTRMEFITDNGVLTEREMVNLFNKCDPAILMDEEELGVFESLPDEIVVYRGIRTGSKKWRGMSWTTDIGVAEWFSKRFNSNGSFGEVYEAKINKRDVLACFNNRNEHEVVVNPRRLTCNRKIKVEEQRNNEHIRLQFD